MIPSETCERFRLTNTSQNGLCLSNAVGLTVLQTVPQDAISCRKTVNSALMITVIAERTNSQWSCASAQTYMAHSRPICVSLLSELMLIFLHSCNWAGGLKAQRLRQEACGLVKDGFVYLYLYLRLL